MTYAIIRTRTGGVVPSGTLAIVPIEDVGKGETYTMENVKAAIGTYVWFRNTIQSFSYGKLLVVTTPEQDAAIDAL